jgi:hypothetical protein
MSTDISIDRLSALTIGDRRKIQSASRSEDIAKLAVQKKRTIKRSRRSNVQRAFDMATVWGAGRGLISAISEVQTVKLSPRFQSEGGVQPTDACRRLAQGVIRYFCHDFWKPSRVGASIEGGLMLVYRHSDGTVFEVEIDNELSIICVVSRDRSVLDSQEFKTALGTYRFVKNFRS